jgi:uncharacterized membrane protein
MLAVLVVGVVSLIMIMPAYLLLNYLFYGNILGMGAVAFDARYFAHSAVNGIVSTALSYPAVAGLYFMALKRVRGERYGIGDAFAGFSHFPSLVVAGAATWVLIYGGLLLFVIPGFYAIGITAFAPLVAIDQKCSGVEAVRISIEALKKQGFQMFGLLFVTYVLITAGLIACCVGILFLAPLLYFVVALHYNSMFPPQGSYGQQPVMPAAPQYSA